MKRWTSDDVPPQNGRTAIVTGANTGIGFETARELVNKGANVILACRNLEKGREAVARIEAKRYGGTAELRLLDLSDLASVHDFAQRILADKKRLDLLINNAGVMVPPFGRTKQGFELQFGTNHLGHFALGAHLLPLLQATPDSRLVVVYSMVYRFGRIDFEDPNYEHRPYRANEAYSQSKLCNLLYAFELQRRIGTSGSPPVVTAAHPGWTATDLQRTSRFTRMLNPLFGMTPPEGALPTLRAATDPAAPAGSYWGPARFWQLRGPPIQVDVNRRARDQDAAVSLWDLSEKLTNVHYTLPVPLTP
jgi:NAD(P)-dependent dehydrogenase (short-subunit alcohol dehydrogenase family)